MTRPIEQLRQLLLSKPMVRPWALAGPIVILLITLPLLRPLRHPSDVSADEMLRLATVQALVEQRTLAIDPVLEIPTSELVERDGRLYSPQPPMLALLLSVPAWVMTRLGLSFEQNTLLVSYMLTLLGVTLPVALSAGLVYRMGRMFELRRYWRAGLGLAVVLGSGLISYAVVINQHAPAAALVLWSAACLVRVAASERAGRRWAWMLLGGVLMGLAATIDPPAAVLALLFMFVIAAMRFSLAARALSLVLYLMGLAVPVAVHVAWNQPITGDWLPASVHEEIAHRHDLPPPLRPPAMHEDDEPGATVGPTFWQAVQQPIRWLFAALFGAHGILSHFPVVVLGVAGVFAVMHRHWPSATKLLAASSLVGGVTIVLMYCIWRAEFADAMFAARWFVVFLPLLVFWAGAWARRSHRPMSWVLAGLLLAFSSVVSLIGATGPYPSEGFRGYTAVSAARRLLTVQPVPSGGEAVAGNATEP